MSERRSTHSTFSLERVYDVPPSRVFQAFADPATKQRWFAGPPEWHQTGHQMEFRPGGTETHEVGLDGGPVHAFEARYYDIVPDERIVFSYEMRLDDVRVSVSLTTIELTPEGESTRLVFTEQGVFLDAADDVEARKEGTVSLLDNLGAELADSSESRQPASR